MADFKNLPNLQAFFNHMQTTKRKVSVRCHTSTDASKGTVIHAADDYVAIQAKEKQQIVPYSAIWKVDIAD